MLCAAMHDRASVNSAGLRVLCGPICPNLFDGPRFSHSFNNAGQLIELAVLDEFTSHWLSLMSVERGHNARLAWKTETGKYPMSYSATRWYGNFELQEKDLFLQFPTVDLFAHTYLLVQPKNKSCACLVDILDAATKCFQLKLNLQSK